MPAHWWSECWWSYWDSRSWATRFPTIFSSMRSSLCLLTFSPFTATRRFVVHRRICKKVNVVKRILSFNFQCLKKKTLVELTWRTVESLAGDFFYIFRGFTRIIYVKLRVDDGVRLQDIEISHFMKMYTEKVGNSSHRSSTKVREFTCTSWTGVKLKMNIFPFINFNYTSHVSRVLSRVFPMFTFPHPPTPNYLSFKTHKHLRKFNIYSCIKFPRTSSAQKQQRIINHRIAYRLTMMEWAKSAPTWNSLAQVQRRANVDVM